MKKARISCQKTFVIVVYVNISIRKYLGMKSHDNKFKILIKYDPKSYEIADCPTSIDNLVQRICEDVPLLRDRPFLLKFSIRNGKSHLMDNVNVSDLISTAVMSNYALSLFVEPSLAFPPLDCLDTAISITNPKTDSFSMVSLYNFFYVDDPPRLAEAIKAIWNPLLILGRVYIAEEGINAQISVPTNVVQLFIETTRKLPNFSQQYFNIDHTLTAEQFNELQPFKSLHVRLRNQVLADGLASSERLDLTRNGREMSPRDWHNAIDDPQAVILDCRNSYESDVGKFVNAVPLNTSYFRESWQALDAILKDKPKHTPILTYVSY